MRLILLGPPGVGKGTQVALLKQHGQFLHISASDLLRKALQSGTPFQAKIQEALATGRLVDDGVIIPLLSARLAHVPLTQGLILDGVPRNVAQARALMQTKINVDALVYLTVSDPLVMVKRLQGRWIHPRSGRVYHEIFCPPQREKLDDVTGEPLVKREDDQPEIILKRLEVYQKETEPVLTYYLRHSSLFGAMKVIQLSADGSPQEVFRRMLDALS